MECAPPPLRTSLLATAALLLAGACSSGDRRGAPSEGLAAGEGPAAEAGGAQGEGEGEAQGPGMGAGEGEGEGEGEGQGTGEGEGEGAAPPPDPATDPTDLAAQVRTQELEDTIADLVGFGTRHTLSPGAAAAQRYLEGRLEDLGYAVEVDDFRVSLSPAANVIARKPGSVTPEQVVIFSAHYDSTSDRPQEDAPGADDNASAVAAVLEAARLMAPERYEASIWFVFTGAEEQGSKGSEHMVRWLAEDDVDVRAVIAPDMIGYWPLGDVDELDLLGDEASEALVEQVAAMAERLGVPVHTWIEHGYCYGDDHTNFQEAGYPTIAPMDCVEAHNVGGSGEETPHYHKTSDLPETLYMPFTTRVVEVLVASLAELARPAR